MTKYLQQRWFEGFAVAICAVFGVALVLNIHPAGDGMWFWYAWLLRNHVHLYADLHYPLQPLFPLLTALSQQVLGESWLASKVLAVGQIAGCVSPLYLIGRRIGWSQYQTGMLVMGAFFLSIMTPYARFDDYHATAFCMEAFCAYFLLLMGEGSVSSRRAAVLGVAIGILSGITMADRLNEGGVLLVSCAVVAFCVAGRRRTWVPILIGVTAGAVFLGTILATEDTLHEWFLNSIVRAIAIKGGGGSVGKSALLFPIYVLGGLLAHITEVLRFLEIAVLATVCANAKRIVRRSDGTVRWAAAILLGVYLVASVAHLLRVARVASPAWSVASVGVLVFYAIEIVFIVRTLPKRLWSSESEGKNEKFVLLVPFALLLAGAMTSGTSILEAFLPLSLFMVLLPLFAPDFFQADDRRKLYATLALLIAISGGAAKFNKPYDFHAYHDETMFKGREWYRHPSYGPMYIDSLQLAMMRSMCGTIQAEPGADLLSLPFPYPNYFCAVRPWNGYVQSWYDLSGKQVVDSMVSDLKHPPAWIVYQRSVVAMHDHEVAFRHGAALPHRQLDVLIEDHIAKGEWTLVSTYHLYASDWLLIRTH